MFKMLQSTTDDWSRPITVNPGNLTTPTRTTTVLTQSTTSNTLPGPQQFWGNPVNMRGFQSFAACAPSYEQNIRVPFGIANSGFGLVPQKREDSPSPFAFNLPPATPAQPTWPWIPSSTAHSSHPYPQTTAYATPETAYPQYGNPSKVVPMSYHQHLQLVPPGRSNTGTTMGSRSSDEVVQGKGDLCSTPTQSSQAGSFAYTSPTSSSTQQITPTHSFQLASPASGSITSTSSSRDLEPSNESRRPPVMVSPRAVGPPMTGGTPRKKKRTESKTGPNFLTKLYE
jgi:hypothetical protein